MKMEKEVKVITKNIRWVPRKKIHRFLAIFT